MASERLEYVIDFDGMSPADASRSCRDALEVLAAEIGRAETDIPWAERESWPEEVVLAACRLRDRFVPLGERGEVYMRTGVQRVMDDGVLADYLLVAPHAYDAQFWREDFAEVASLADESQSFVAWLTEEHRASVVARVGHDRVVRLAEWRAAHRSAWRRWIDDLGAAMPRFSRGQKEPPTR
jgi:hypothetical protein